MKIKWIHATALQVPGVGMLGPGDVREVPDELGRALIKQNMAEAVAEAPVKMVDKRAKAAEEEGE